MKTAHVNSTLVAAIAAALALPISVRVAVAQEAAAGGLEEIVVTARKREENIQDVGIAMSALSQTEVERSFARDLKDLASMSPNLVIDDTSQGPGGVAAITSAASAWPTSKRASTLPSAWSSTGVHRLQHRRILKSLDIAKHRSLRGPREQLFGRNTIGGVIKSSASKPTGKFGGKVRAGYGAYDTYDLEGILNFPITDKLAAKLSAGKPTIRKASTRITITESDDDGPRGLQDPRASTCCTRPVTRWSSSTPTTTRRRIRTPHRS